MITISWWIFGPMAAWTAFGLMVLCGTIWDHLTDRPRTPLHDIPTTHVSSGIHYWVDKDPNRALCGTEDPDRLSTAWFSVTCRVCIELKNQACKGAGVTWHHWGDDPSRGDAACGLSAAFATHQTTGWSKVTCPDCLKRRP